jgi:hypothetical protein
MNRRRGHGGQPMIGNPEEEEGEGSMGKTHEKNNATLRN